MLLLDAIEKVRVADTIGDFEPDASVNLGPCRLERLDGLFHDFHNRIEVAAELFNTQFSEIVLVVFFAPIRVYVRVCMRDRARARGLSITRIN